MTATYDITTSVGKVRLITGDTDIHPSSDAVFTDEEITYFLTAQSSDINLASADVLDAWAAKYIANADSETIGDYQYAQSTAKKMIALANNLRDKVAAVTATTPAMDWAEMDLINVTEDTE